MKHAIPAVLSLTLLAACAASPEPSARAQDCNLKARSAPSPYPSAPSSAYGSVVALSPDDTRDQFERSEFRRCMEAKGP